MIDFEVLTDLKSGGFGAEQSRSWFMSYSSLEDLEKGNNKTCPNIITLNGEWNFNYFNDVRAAQNFPDIEYPLTVKVPHSAQLDGFDRPIYCGGGYIMPYFPPYVPKENPAFAYKKIVNLHNILHYSYIVYRFTHVFIKLYTVFCNDNADYMHSI